MELGYQSRAMVVPIAKVSRSAPTLFANLVAKALLETTALLEREGFHYNDHTITEITSLDCVIVTTIGRKYII
jgi:hypothetical protein